MISHTKRPFGDRLGSLGTCLSLTWVLACILLVIEYYHSFVLIYPILCYQRSLGTLRPSQNAHLPTHTRPSTPTARPGGQSQRKDPSLLMQCPFMQMPGVWHSSTSAQRRTEAGPLQSRRLCSLNWSILLALQLGDLQKEYVKMATDLLQK